LTPVSGRAGATLAPVIRQEAVAMLDVLFVALTVAFFAVAWAYVRGCERI
jgi:hypothetical protein